MSYETVAEKKDLARLLELVSGMYSSGISYGKILATVNLGCGKDRPAPPPTVRKPTIELTRERRKKVKVAMFRAKALFLVQLTGAEVRTVKAFPAEMADKVRDDQTVGEVFSVAAVELALKSLKS